MRLFILVAIISSAFCSSAFAHCQYSYGELIARHSKCDRLHLPDFYFRQVPQAADAPAHIKRFCSRYEVSSGANVQFVNYCYTGEGDKIGPAFKIGGREFLADLNFVGCIDGKKVEGIIFLSGGWSNAPKNIERLWPVESLPSIPTCKS